MCAQAAGLSPRARGNPLIVLTRSLHIGSIPACAGESRTDRNCPCIVRVYPRVRGGIYKSGRGTVPEAGLSPRARGNQVSGFSGRVVWGSIPACAGESRPLRPQQVAGGVYPRVRGGIIAGYFFLAVCSGLSPRARGNLGDEIGEVGDAGSIPACAGESGHSRG